MNNERVPRTVEEPQITDDSGGAEIVPFPRMHRPGSRLPHQLLKNTRCIICNHYGCVVRYVTHPDLGGTQTGDNLIPVCRDHSYISIVILYRAHPIIRTWLIEHERIDAVLWIEDKIRERNSRG